MKSILWTVALLAVCDLSAAPAVLAERIPWTCDNVDDVECPDTHNKRIESCQATNGIDTFLEKAGRRANKCRLSKVVVQELCYSGFDPAKFDLTCQDKEDDETERRRDWRGRRPSERGTWPEPATSNDFRR